LRRSISLAWDVITSLKLTIVCLALLMAEVLLCTFAQVSLGTFESVKLFMRSFLVWWHVPGTGWSIVVFPGGALIGLVLALNLVAAQVRRLQLSWAKAGLWIVHLGLILLFVGEFVTASYQVDANLAVEQGQTVNFVEESRVFELAVVDGTDPDFDDVYGIPESRLSPGTTVALPGTPVSFAVKAYFRNAQLSNRQPSDPPAAADRGVGASVTLRPAPPVTSDDERNRPAAVVEAFAGGKSYGTWLLSTALGAPQGFTHEGRDYRLSMRPRREYLPYSLTLKKFSHDIYPGTDIPKNFSSLVRLLNPSKHEDREVLIYMNQPLRYEGKAFYQASFGKGDTLSILQVVQNPGWLLPYISCVLVTLGLLVHFGITLRRGLRKQQAALRTPLAASRAAASEASPS
jgi:hypothetical protein